VLHPRLPSPGAVLRKLLEEKTIIAPGVFDAMTCLLAQQAGAKALYITGAGITNSQLAVPDIALITLNEMAQYASAITRVAKVPVICDADTGYGGTMNVIRAIREFENVGLAGAHIEDQVHPKRCGHLEGKQLVAPEEMAAKIRAAVKARADNSFMVIARTDARGVTGLEDAISRARLYIRSGADCIFPEGLESKEEFAVFRDKVPGLLMANMTEFGKTPLISAKEFEELGYNIVIFPMTAFRMAMESARKAYDIVLREGTQASILDKMMTREELYRIIEYEAYNTIDRKIAEEVQSFIKETN